MDSVLLSGILFSAVLVCLFEWWCSSGHVYIGWRETESERVVRDDIAAFLGLAAAGARADDDGPA